MKSSLKKSRSNSVLLSDEVGQLMDGSKADAIHLLLGFAKESYRKSELLISEHVNLLDAIRAAYENQEWLNVVDFALVLDVFLDTHGYWQEDIYNLQLALEAAKKLEPGYESRLALVLHNLAVIYMSQGQDERAASYFDQSLTVHRQLGDKLAMSRALHYLGRIHSRAQQQDLALELLEQSLTLGQEAHDDRGVSATLHELGNFFLGKGDLAKAEDYYQRSLTSSRMLNILYEIATTLHQLGVLNHRRGNLEEALSLFKEALQLRYQAGHIQGIAESLYNLGNLAFENKLLDQAKQHWQESLRIFERLGMPEAGAVQAKLSGLVGGDIK